jgi:hypothetical protein
MKIKGEEYLPTPQNYDKFIHHLSLGNTCQPMGKIDEFIKDVSSDEFFKKIQDLRI